MGDECRKAYPRRKADPRFTPIMQGHALDIGAGYDPLGNQDWPFTSIRHWDQPDGDAETLPGIPSHTFDCVHSSHCLEHMRDATAAWHRWWEVVRPGGWLVVLVPDEDLYEQGVWPSTFNPDHKWTFTVAKATSWSPVSLNVTDLVAQLSAVHQHWITRLTEHYRFDWPRADQTSGPAPCAIEVCVQKSPNP